MAILALCLFAEAPESYWSRVAETVRRIHALDFGLSPRRDDARTALEVGLGAVTKTFILLGITAALALAMGSLLALAWRWRDARPWARIRVTVAQLVHASSIFGIVVLTAWIYPGNAQLAGFLVDVAAWLPLPQGVVGGLAVLLVPLASALLVASYRMERRIWPFMPAGDDQRLLRVSSRQSLRGAFARTLVFAERRWGEMLLLVLILETSIGWSGVLQNFMDSFRYLNLSRMLVESNQVQHGVMPFLALLLPLTAAVSVTRLVLEALVILIAPAHPVASNSDLVEIFD